MNKSNSTDWILKASLCLQCFWSGLGWKQKRPLHWLFQEVFGIFLNVLGYILIILWHLCITDESERSQTYPEAHQENTVTVEKWTKEPLCFWKVSVLRKTAFRRVSVHFWRVPVFFRGVSEESLLFPQSLTMFLKNIIAFVNKLLWSYGYLRYMYSTRLILHEFAHLFKEKRITPTHDVKGTVHPKNSVIYSSHVIRILYDFMSMITKAAWLPIFFKISSEEESHTGLE